MKSDITYAIMELDTPKRDETPLTAKTDRGARIQAEKIAKKQGIKDYKLIFYRASDGCRGWF